MTTALYPGSFDPITLGHLNIIERAAAIFDRVVVCVMTNSAKKTLFTPEERLAFVEKTVRGLPNVRAAAHSGLLADFAREQGCGVIVKGVRTVADYEYEQQLRRINLGLLAGLETVLLTAEPELAHVSSTVAREMLRYDADLSPYVPSPVVGDVKTLYKLTGGK